MPKTVDVDNSDTSFKSTFNYDDVDLSEFTDEELEALGIDPSSIEGRGEEDDDEEEETEEEDQENEEEEDGEEEEDTEGEEEDDEEEEDEDGEGEEEEEEKEPEKKDRRKEPRIPKSRFDEAVQKEREKFIRAEERSKYLEERIEQLLALQEKVTEKEPETLPEFDFIEAEEKYAQLLIEGELKDAAKLRVKINEEKDKWVQSLIKEVQETTLKEAEKNNKTVSEKEKKNLVIQQAFIDYPFLDENNEDFNEELVEDINSLAVGYQNKGVSPSEALQKAIDKLAKPLVKKEEPPKAKKSTESKRKKVKKMAQQPPNMKESGKIKDKNAEDFDWESMSQAEFEKLMNESPEIVKEAMRKNYAV